MEIEDQVTEVSQPDDDVLPTDRESLADRLRRQRKEQAENTWHDVDIPGYNGELFCRYRLLESQELDGIGRKVRQEVRDRSERILAAAMDGLILSCMEFFVREDGREMPLREHPTYQGPKDVPVRYDINLAEYLEFTDQLSDPPSARGVVLALFGGNDVAVQTHSALNAQWMMRGGAEVDMLLGEV